MTIPGFGAPPWWVIVQLGCGGPAQGLPSWGTARFDVTGDGAVHVETRGVTCDAAGATVRSGDGPFWALTVSSSPPSVWWSRRAARPDAIRPGPTWIARDPAGLRFDGQRAVLSGIVLVGEPGGAPLRIDGEIVCPTPADPVDDAAVRALADASGAPVERVGARARVRVELARVGAVVDGTRGRVGPGVVVWAGAVGEAGTGEVWVARGAAASDVVRYAGCGGPDAPWIAERVTRWVADHHVDVIAADPGSLTARLPPDTNVRVLAAEVAEVCPAVLDAEDASLAALEAQLVRDRQIVCWWP